VKSGISKSDVKNQSNFAVLEYNDSQCKNHIFGLITKIDTNFSKKLEEEVVSSVNTLTGYKFTETS